MASPSLPQLELAAQALAAFGLPASTPLELLKQRENHVYGLEHAGKQYVLRIHRQGYHTDDELACEIDFVNALRDQGVAVPEFISGPDGAWMVAVGEHSPLGRHQADLQRYLPNDGTFGDERTGFDGSAAISPDDFNELGRLIANAHDATERSGYRMRVPRDDWDVEGLVGTKPAWGDPLRIAELSTSDRTLLSTAIARIREQLTDYGTPAHRFGPIHADLTPENVLRTNSGLTLIDFDDFAAGWHLFDLATALYFYTAHPRYAQYEAALFAGYEGVRPLDRADHDIFPAILIARGLTYLGWSADRRGEPTAEWHATTVLPHALTLSREFLAA